MSQNAVAIIANRLEKVLAEQGYVRAKNESEYKAAFIGEAAAYMVEFESEKKRILLKTAAVVDGDMDDSWKNVSIWGFSPESDDLRQIESIANDFCDTLMAPSRKAEMAKAVKKSKRKKEDDDNVTSVFFIKRCAHIIPELKEELTYHKEDYADIVPMHFCRVHVAPKIVELCSLQRYTPQHERLFETLNNMYKLGDMDVRAMITMIILNSIEDEEVVQRVSEGLSDELKIAWKASVKYKNKKVKPEKVKKPSMMQRMMINEEQQRLNGR